MFSHQRAKGTQQQRAERGFDPQAEQKHEDPPSLLGTGMALCWEMAKSLDTGVGELWVHARSLFLLTERAQVGFSLLS